MRHRVEAEYLSVPTIFLRLFPKERTTQSLSLLWLPLFIDRSHIRNKTVKHGLVVSANNHNATVAKRFMCTMSRWIDGRR